MDHVGMCVMYSTIKPTILWFHQVYTIILHMYTHMHSTIIGHTLNRRLYCMLEVLCLSIMYQIPVTTKDKLNYQNLIIIK